MFQRTVISSPAPAVTYSQLVAGIFAFAKASKSARQIGSAPDAHSSATSSRSFSAPLAVSAFGLDSSAISVAQQDTRSTAAAPVDTKAAIRASERRPDGAARS